MLLARENHQFTHLHINDMQMGARTMLAETK